MKLHVLQIRFVKLEVRYICVRGSNARVLFDNSRLVKYSCDSPQTRQDSSFVIKNHPFLKRAKEDIQFILKQETGIDLDLPNTNSGSDTTTTGNTVRTILWQKKSRDILLSSLKPEHKNIIEDILINLGVILRLLSSSDTIDVDAYKELCSTYINIRKKIPWANVTPTLHKLLGHFA